MRKLFLFSTFILSVALLSCSDMKKNEEETSEAGNNAVETENSDQVNQTAHTGNSSGAAFEKRIQEGEVFLLYNEPESAAGRPSENEEINTVTLPDGRMYRVANYEDNSYLRVPGKGNMQIIKLDNKFYLFDDNDRAYEVKYEDNKLYAEVTTLTDVLLKEKQ